MANGYQKDQQEVQLKATDKNDLTRGTNCLLLRVAIAIERLNENIEMTHDINRRG